MADPDANPFRVLPSIDELAAAIRDDAPLQGVALTTFLQAYLAAWRERIGSGERVTRERIIADAAMELNALVGAKLRPVINATGVIIHTNLGRAPVSAETRAAMSDAASAYVALEIDPVSNERGGRMSEISALMRLLTGAEATLVVNNNAAAVLLTLAAIAAGRSVIVSRGEAVEIGGGFRIPDVMRQSGARLVEVGTTNRTYPRDYAEAVDGDTALILKVHASNFTIEGFTRTVDVEELAPVAAKASVPLVEDLGSGSLFDTKRFGLRGEPTIGASIAAGVDVVTASGDKLLGGPQAGIIAGKADLIDRIERHPLARALRADKTCLAGVAATLRHYARDEAVERIPIWRMIAASVDMLQDRAVSLQARLAEAGVEVEIAETRSTIGGGSLPGQVQPSVALAIGDDSRPDDLARALRAGEPRAFARIDDGRLLLDLRTVLPEDDGILAATVVSALHSLATA
jgi:L-seryl-tRNA(Ser) seleniumtransferase